MTPGGSLAYDVDLANGGRWTSLRTPDREWLWRRPDPARGRVRPGSAFVDAGGLEECLPTVRGDPDHGAVWCREWRADDGRDRVRTDEFTFERRISVDGEWLVADYRLRARPGYQFVWAAHALLALTHRASLEAGGGTPTRVYAEAAAITDRTWPADAAWLEDAWPTPLGLPLSRLGPDDGTAVGAILLTPAVTVADGPDRLELRVTAPGQPTGIALWRNLGGFPAADPYRSVGVEPMVGRVFDPAGAAVDDVGVVGGDGTARWRLWIRAEKMTHGIQ